MMDQAESLRLKLQKLRKKSDAKAISFVSGKGGVGKSNISLNFSIKLAEYGHKVLLFDMDIGMGNIDILMGKTPKHTIVDIFEQKLSLRDIMENGPNENLSYIAAGSGMAKLFKLDRLKLDRFTTQLEMILRDYDYIIFDMGAGVSEDHLKFILATHEVFVITTPEPTSMTDAYAMMKYICQAESRSPFYLLVNRTYSPKEGDETFKRLHHVAKQYLKKNIINLGTLPDDRNVQKAVSRQIPFLHYSATSAISKAMTEVVERYSSKNFESQLSNDSLNFIDKLRHYFRER